MVSSLIFPMETAGQSYSGWIIVRSVATPSTVRVTGGLVLGHKAGDRRGTGTKWRACWSRYTRTDHHTYSREISVQNSWSKRTTGWKHRSAYRKRRIDWVPRSETLLAQMRRENGRRRLEHGRRDDVTVVWQRLWSREDWSGFVLDFMFAPSCATVLEPDL